MHRVARLQSGPESKVRGSDHVIRGRGRVAAQREAAPGVFDAATLVRQQLIPESLVLPPVGSRGTFGELRVDRVPVISTMPSGSHSAAASAAFQA